MPYKTSGAYYMRPTVQPISSVKVREQLEQSKADPLKLVEYLQKVQELPAVQTVLRNGAEAHRQNLIQSNRTEVDVVRAYRFLFRHAEFIAEQGGL